LAEASSKGINWERLASRILRHGGPLPLAEHAARKAIALQERFSHYLVLARILGM
jgi:hypothetical protein